MGMAVGRAARCLPCGSRGAGSQAAGSVRWGVVLPLCVADGAFMAVMTVSATALHMGLLAPRAVSLPLTVTKEGVL